MPNYATYQLTIQTYTPVHIGNGRELLHRYDYAIHHGRTWRINENALLDAQEVDDPQLAEQLAQQPPADLIRDQDFVEGSSLFRYVLHGKPRSQGEGAILKEQIKDAFDQVYIPGSSLKGAFRTALGWYAWEQLGLKADIRQLQDNRQKERPPKFAAKNYEQKIFAPKTPRPGKEPNYDLMRAFQVSDTKPRSTDCLVMVNANVISPGGYLTSQIPVELETIKANTVFEATLKIDLALFSRWAKQHGLNLSGEEWLRNLPEVCRLHASQHITEEIKWFSSIHSAQRVVNAYQQLAQAVLPDNQFPIQLGWGTGWDDKTFGSRLKSDPGTMAYVIKKHARRGSSPKVEDAFPKSRRAIMSSGETTDGKRVEIPMVPLGWVLLTIQPSGGDTHWMSIHGAKTQVVPPSKTPPPEAVQQPDQPATPSPAPKPASPPQPVPPKIPIVEQFTALPEVGQRFRGVVFENQSDGAILLEIPGLDPDDFAMALIPSEQNPGQRRYKEGDQLLCEVTKIIEDPQIKGNWLVVCARI